MFNRAGRLDQVHGRSFDLCMKKYFESRYRERWSEFFSLFSLCRAGLVLPSPCFGLRTSFGSGSCLVGYAGAEAQMTAEII